MATLAQLRAKTQQELQDANGVYFPDAVVDDLLNEAHRNFAEDCRCLRDSYSGDLAGGSAVVSLSSITPAVLEVLRVWVDNQELEYVTPDDLACGWPNYLTDSGTPRRFTREDQGFPTIRLHPAPASDFDALVAGGGLTTDSLDGLVIDIEGLTDLTVSSLSGFTVDVADIAGGIRVDYVAAAPDLSADGDVPAIPAEFHDALFYYAAARCCEMDVPISQRDKAATYMARYQAEVTKCQALVKAGFQRKPAGSLRQRRMEWI